jgi:tripartite-type tricarboxylate transporter receptor subunit TctC
MKRRQVVQTVASLAAAVAWAPHAAVAQSERPLKILLGFPPGGSIDTLARTLADKLKDELKRPVIVESKPGAAGRLAAELFKNTPPDGSTVMITPVVVPVLAPMVFNKLNYDPKTDLVPVAHLANFNFVLTVNADSPAKNIKDLIAQFKTDPQKAAFGSPGAGSLPHFFGLLVGRAAGVEVVHVPFQGGSPMQIALLGNQIPSAIDVETESLQHLKTGKVRALATSAPKRTKTLPDVPTFAEQGFPNIVGSGWFAMFAPAKTPQAEIDRVNAAVNKALALPEVAEKLLALGLEVAGGSPADLQKLLDADTAKWGPIVKASGFKAD